jgi:hypothetical protein
MNKTVRKPYAILYHVFTDNRDESYGDYGRAKRRFNRWSGEGSNARLYAEYYETKAEYEQAEPAEEECLESCGVYPS